MTDECKHSKEFPYEDCKELRLVEYDGSYTCIECRQVFCMKYRQSRQNEKCQCEVLIRLDVINYYRCPECEALWCIHKKIDDNEDKQFTLIAVFKDPMEIKLDKRIEFKASKEIIIKIFTRLKYELKDYVMIDIENLEIKSP